jgi:hypothetical protein
MLVNFSPDPTPASSNPQEDTRGPVATTTVPVSATTTVVLAANPSRAYYLIRNNGNVPVYLTESVAATVANAFYVLQPGKGWEEAFNSTPRYTGSINGITASGTASVIVNEANLLP